MFSKLVSHSQLRSSATFGIDHHSPLTELGIIPNDEPDRNQLEHILVNVLGYPSSEVARVHKECNRLGSLDLMEGHQNKLTLDELSELNVAIKFCPCCGYIRQESSIKLCTPVGEVSNIGLSTYLYFRTLIVLVIMLAIMFFIYSCFAIFTNILASNSYEVNDNMDPSLITNVGVLVISLGSKQLNATNENTLLYNIQTWFGVGVLLLWVGFLIVAKGKEKKEQKRIRDQSYSAADFSIIIENIPNQVGLQDIQRSFYRYAQQTGLYSFTSMKIAKFNAGRPFYLNEEQFKDQRLADLNAQHKAMVEKFSEWVLERTHQNHFSVSQAERQAEYIRFKEVKQNRLKAYKQISQRIIADFKREGESLTYTGFVTFDTNRDKEVVMNLNGNRLTDRIRNIIWCCGSSSRLKITNSAGNVVQVTLREAPEPEDIIWTNLGHSKGERTKRRIITYVVTLVLLAISFGVVYGLSALQIKVNNDKALSLLISVVISGFNLLIQFAIRELTRYEREYTETNHQTTLGLKSVLALLINSIMIPILVNYAIKRNLYGKNGLAYDVFYLGLTNSFLTPILKIFDLQFIYSRIMARYQNSAKARLKLSQQELNDYTEYSSFEVGYEYIYAINLFLFTCFFASLQPIIAIFAIFGLTLMFWAQKNAIYGRYKRPVPGTTTINNTMYQFIYLGGIFFSLGSLSWASFFPQGAHNRGFIPNMVCLGISVIMFLLPYDVIFEYAYRDEEDEHVLKFEDYRIFLPSEYDRLNPATSEEALAEFMEYIKVQRQRIQERRDEGEAKRLEQIFIKQMGRGRQINSILPTFGGLLPAFDKDNKNVLQSIFGQEAQIINPLLLGASIIPKSFAQNARNLWSQIGGQGQMQAPGQGQGGMDLENALFRRIQSQVRHNAKGTQADDYEQLDPFMNNIFQKRNEFTKIFNLNEGGSASQHRDPNPYQNGNPYGDMHSSNRGDRNSRY